MAKRAKMTLFSQQQPEQDTKSRWLDLFGTVIVVQDAGLHLPESSRTLSCEDWQTYFELCGALNPVLTTEATYIVRQYFMVNRQYRPAHQFKPKSISILFLMSKCIAKLNFRIQVSRQDAVLAVMLYEQQLQQLYPNAMSPIFFQFRDLTHISDMESDGQQQNMSSLLDVSQYLLYNQLPNFSICAKLAASACVCKSVFACSSESFSLFCLKN